MPTIDGVWLDGVKNAPWWLHVRVTAWTIYLAVTHLTITKSGSSGSLRSMLPS
ncbi:hypothetical protein AB4Y89_07415 [Terriglobus sp. 2YAB30_2]|uniref:hypothetical protein n=1 Tax=unclassified Terriglobus TaxID=2628988 RepID=UPI003F9AB8A6